MQASPQAELPLPVTPSPRRTARHRPVRTLSTTIPTKLLCLDIETVPDEDLLPPDWDREKFPKVAWHRVVSIAFAVAGIDIDPITGIESFVVESCRSGGEPDWDEKRLLQGFWQFFAAGDYRLVTWNGRAFDLPVLLTRAFIYGIPTGAYYLRGDRWTGYANRYATDYHADLMDLMSQHGAATRMGLDEMAVAMGLPGKGGEHGSSVAALVAEGRIERVRNYCECDVLNTLALYVRWCLASGRSTPEGHDAALRGLIAYLSAEGPGRPHLAAFLETWTASTRPSPTFSPRARTRALRDRDRSVRSQPD